MSSAPRPLIVPANTSAPGDLSAGSDSPVTGAWFTSLWPATTSPSSGIFSPGRTTITMPGRTASTPMRCSPCGPRTSASTGVRSISAPIAVRARSSVRVSSVCATANKNTTAAASDHCPSATAPMAAVSISTLMSIDRTRAACTALRSVNAPPQAIETPNTTRTIHRVAPNSSRPRPAAKAAPDAQTSVRCQRAALPVPMTGSSCSSQARMPASATAAVMVEVDSLAASYFTCSRWPIRSAEKSSRPGMFLNRRSSIVTSSRQSIPSTLNVDSA